MKDFQDIDAHLEDWSAVRAILDFNGILIGNGASRTIWEDFAYDSLFENARTIEEKPLSQSELSVFDALQTRSFEQALGALKTTSRVNKALAVSSAAPRNRYYAIKEALINTIHAVHIPWRLVQPSTLATISSELMNYPTVFTSNYDLLNYWAILHTPGIDDLFRSADASFDLRDNRTSATRILYLHGGLHLVRNLDGTARKLPTTDSTLLSSFAINNTLKTLDDVPLFVSEGKVEEKLKTIRSSDYLSFCYEQLLNHKGALCIFGHGLGPQDAHLVDAIRQAKLTTLAISVSGRSDGFIRQQKRRYSELFDGTGVELKFFAARTHPLGNPALSVPVER
ncbi:protein of unknown function [Pseudomonas cedrina]|uniref:DUF4917 domain-containing protein n=2 Tax=Pseudomonas cedrina TaxID=651740 RepID=A0A1V2KFH4_PSECE|nr:DUF4917 family protein [Pseudomonas cedrina]ONH56507.1 DUF4917 domain-containing protein [Pseudomonas cedrina subsp. cedrina]SDS05654.1 protein of unknown function [Pseudomonas cedrina]